VKQLEIKIDAKAISLDEIDTTAAWRVEVEEPVTETALDWLEDSGDDHGIYEDFIGSWSGISSTTADSVSFSLSSLF
jgi:hypothetical protein